MKIASTAGENPTGKKKSKFPWGTIFLTGVVTTIGTVVTMRLIEAATKRRAGEDDVNAQREALLNPASIGALPQATQQVPVPRTVSMTEDTLLLLTQNQLH